MWQMIAGPNISCAECKHSIQPGRLCLSELPEEIPSGVERRQVRNYCVGCPQCWSQGKHACYLRQLERGRNIAETPRSLPCVNCGNRIGGHQQASVDRYYEWPSETAEGQTTNPRQLPAGSTGAASAAIAAGGATTLIRGVPEGGFTDLSSSLQQKFAQAGLGAERGTRSLAEAQSFYEDSIPTPVQNLGEDAVREFTDGKHASHIQSVHNAPHLAAENANIVWEDGGANVARGASDMSQSNLTGVHLSNGFQAGGIVFRDCLEAGTMSSVFGGLLEAPVATIENYLHYQRGRKTGEEAVKDAAKAIGTRAAISGGVGMSITAAVSLLKAGTIIATIAPILMPVGLGLYAYAALKRLNRAAEYDIPPGMVEAATYFCSPRCHERFAYATGYSALMRWEGKRSQHA